MNKVQKSAGGAPPGSDLLSLGIASVAANVALAAVKVVAGVVGNSYALVADGIESASDIVSSLIAWAGFHISLAPPDAEHPYGHGKIESLAGLCSGLSLLVAAGVIASQAISEIRNASEAPAWFTLPILVAVVVVKEMLSRRVMAAGAALESRALEGEAWHHRSDAITSGATGVGIAIALFCGPGYEAADDWAALLACGVIAVNGAGIIRNAINDVLDGAVPDDARRRFIAIAAGVSGVDSIEKTRLRRSGIGMFIEIHVQVRPSMSVLEGHAVGHAVKDAILEAEARVIDVFVHLEPSGSAAV